MSCCSRCGSSIRVGRSSSLLSSSRVNCRIVLLLKRVGFLHLRAGMQLIHHGQEYTERQFDLRGQVHNRSFGLQHPQRDLDRLAIGVLHRGCLGGLTRLGQHVETLVMERVKGVMHRHGGRHGIQIGCCSMYISICCSWMGFTRKPNTVEHGSSAPMGRTAGTDRAGAYDQPARGRVSGTRRHPRAR